MDLSEAPYYFDTLTRSEATILLKENQNGSFLLRKRRQPDEEDSYALSVLFENKVYHYNIAKCEETGLFQMENGSGHRSPVTLCEHYMNYKGGLKTKLLHPVTVNNSNDQQRLGFNKVSSTYMVAYEDYAWYHGQITRYEDNERLSKAYNKLNQNGIFLVRSKAETEFVLSLINEANFHRYRIIQNQDTKQFWMSERMPEFDSLSQLIHFMVHNDKNITGLACRLTIPCPKNISTTTLSDLTTTSSSVHHDSENALSRKVKNIASSLVSQFKPRLLISSDLSDIETSSNFEDEDFLEDKDLKTSSKSFHIKNLLKFFSRKSLPRDSIGYSRPKHLQSEQAIAKHLYIKRRDLKEKGVLGRGHFGVVSLGEWCTFSGYVVDCAIKSLSGPDVERNKDELLNEAMLMQKLDNPYIVRMLGICDDKHGILLVLELAPLGSIKNFLKSKNTDTFPERKILSLMEQVCEGMAYLSENNVVHRDLAARNILLVSEKYAKISDFGMSRVLCENEDFYTMSTPGPLPMRWYAPELFVERKFTSKADVWSFGVTMWECFSYDERPYKDKKRHELMEAIKSGTKLSKPDGCSDSTYYIMTQCWELEPGRRPSFVDLLLLF